MRKLLLVFLLISFGCAGYFSNEFSRIKRVAWSTQSRRDIDSLWSWSVEENRELAVCLYGQFNLNSTTAFVLRTESPIKEVELSTNSATIICNNTNEFLGLAHTHPNGTIYLSQGDKSSFDQGAFPLMVVISSSTRRTTYKQGEKYPIEEVY